MREWEDHTGEIGTVAEGIVNNRAVEEKFAFVLDLRPVYTCIIMVKNGGVAMKIPTLRVEPKKYTGESTVVSMRMPRDMVQELDRIAASTGYTRTELMMACLEFSMNHMEIMQKETNRRA